MRISLPDVNVWLALAAEGHPHHQSARKWFDGEQNDAVAFCRITQMGLLRLLTNLAALRTGVRTVAQAWDIYASFRTDRRVIFSTEPPTLDESWRAMMSNGGPTFWTDAYLAAFAEKQDYTFVTFDHGFARWPNLSLSLLT